VAIGVLLVVLAILAAVLFYLHCRRKAQAQQAVSADSELPPCAPTQQGNFNSQRIEPKETLRVCWVACSINPKVTKNVFPSSCFRSPSRGSNVQGAQGQGLARAFGQVNPAIPPSPDP